MRCYKLVRRVLSTSDTFLSWVPCGMLAKVYKIGETTVADPQAYALGYGLAVYDNPAAVAVYRHTADVGGFGPYIIYSRS